MRLVPDMAEVILAITQFTLSTAHYDTEWWQLYLGDVNSASVTLLPSQRPTED